MRRGKEWSKCRRWRRRCGEKGNGGPVQTRTADLYRVKVAQANRLEVLLLITKELSLFELAGIGTKTSELVAIGSAGLVLHGPNLLY